jgi:hypothetical protein
MILVDDKYFTIEKIIIIIIIVITTTTTTTIKCHVNLYQTDYFNAAF